MSTYSTIQMSRAECLVEIVTWLKNATDEELAEALFALCGDKTGHDFVIVKPKPKRRQKIEA